MTDQEIQYFNEVVNPDQGRTDLVLVTYFRREYTMKCLESLWARTKTPYRLTVVDNGSTDGTAQWLAFQKDAGKIDNLILLDRNYGLEYARNTALRHLHSEYVVFFDNDLLVPDLEPDWLSREVDAMRRNEKEFGCIALRPQVLVGPPNDLWDTDKEIVEFRHVGATFMMFRLDVLKSILWEDQFTNRVADWRMGDRLKEKGLKMGWVKDLFCFHLFGKDWGYPSGVKHFHRDMWPPSEWYDKFKVDPKTLRPV